MQIYWNEIKIKYVVTEYILLNNMNPKIIQIKIINNLIEYILFDNSPGFTLLFKVK